MEDANRDYPEAMQERSDRASPSLPVNSEFLLNTSSNPHEDSRRYWQALKRKKLVLVGAAIGGAILGFVGTLPAVSVFQAHASVEVAGINGNFMNIKQSDPVNYADSEHDSTDLQTQVLVLRSDSLNARVQSKLRTTTSRASSETLLRKLGPNYVPLTADIGKALAMATKSLRAWPSPSSRVIQITVDCTDPSIAADYVNTLVNEFIEQNIEARWQSSLRTSQWLTRQIDDMRIKLEQSENKLQEYSSQAGLLFSNDKSSVAEDHLRQLQVQLSTVQADRIAKQTRLEMLSVSPADSVPDILEDDTIRAYREKIADLQRQMADLSPTYAPESTRIRRIQAQVESLQQANAEVRTMIGRRIRNEYTEALSREHMVEADFRAQTSQVSSEGERMIRYNILKGDVDSNRQIYDTMLQQLRQSAIASAMRASNIRVVDAATKPEHPYRPNRDQASLAGAIAALILCAAAIVLRQYTDRVIRDPGEVVAWTGVPELGLIPDYRIGHLSRYRASRTPLVQRSSRDGSDPSLSITDLKAVQRERSRVSECFRSTLTSMLFARQNGGRPRTVVITSASPREGKSTVTANLGIALAQVGIRVLLIDADLRRPCLYKLFDLKPAVGLADLLKATDAEEVPVDAFIQSTGVEGLSIISAGTESPGSTNLLYCDRFATLVRRLRDRYEIVLVDTPPMLGIPDARLIARATDKTILVVRAGKTTRSAAAAAAQRLADDGIDLLGAIVNAWSPSDSPEGYYGYGARYYWRHYYESGKAVGT